MTVGPVRTVVDGGNQESLAVTLPQQNKKKNKTSNATKYPVSRD